jgi:hypothetical protein
MKIKRTTIWGYNIELEFEEGANTQGWVSSGGFGASLDYLLQAGSIANEDGKELYLKPACIKDINEWAKENGY